jgi:hypothetical protein|tara:strand:- start:617 stop:961 length:345 start_codon:yes stop_codon:yes gene_type:complete
MSLGKRIAAKRAEEERGFLDVEEWGEGDQPQRLYFTTVSARDMEQIQRRHKDFINNPTMSAMIDLIIRKCEDDAGEKVLTIEDKPALMGEPLNLIAKVFGAVLESVTIEEHEKN